METPASGPTQQLPAFLHKAMRLRQGCKLVLQQFRETPSYVLEDSLSGQFFHIGLREEKLIRQLDGSLTGIEILTGIDPANPEALDAHQILMLLSMLRSSNLLDGCPPDEAPAPSLLRTAIAKNPLFLRIPVGNPDPFLTRFERHLRWMFHPWFSFLLGALFLFAVLAVASDWQRFSDKAQTVLASENWLWLIVTFLGLKLVHELGHGIVCKHFGGRIPDFGLYFMFFTPLTYVDATSSWAFPSRHNRILVSAAGMISEMTVAAIAALIWASSETGVLNTLAYNTIISATVVTLFFNINPLLRFDGYYMLSDLTGEPNLYSRAGFAGNGWIRWLLLGIKPDSAEPLWIGIYGISCTIWRLLLTVSICVGAVVLLQGLGMILAGLYLTGMAIPLIKKFHPRSLPKGTSGLRAVIVVAIILLLLCLPIRQTITAPGVIQAADLTSIRVACPGFVREIFVSPGEDVEKDALLVQLVNPDEIARLKGLETSALIAETEAHRALLDRNPQLEAKKMEEVRSLQSQASERAAFCASLDIRAPHAGIVIGREIKNLGGSFLPTGEELFAIGSATEREVHILIPEEYAQMIQGKPGDEVHVFLRNQGRTINAVLTRIEPRANRKIRFPEVTATAGGSITVRRQEKSGDETPGGMEMVQPHFIATARLIDSPLLLSGETCLVRLNASKSEPVAFFIWHQFERLIRRYVGRSDHTPV